MNVSTKEFSQFLIDQQPVYDREIIKDIRPEDPSIWLLPQNKRVDMFPFSNYEHALNEVRKLVEGLAFEPVISSSLKRFNKAFPKIKWP